MKDDKRDLISSLLGLTPKPRSNNLLDALRKRNASTVPLGGLLAPVPPVPPAPSRPLRCPVGIAVATSLTRFLLAKKSAPAVNAGRVLPSLDDLAIGEGRRLNVAFVYTDLHGFTNLVATAPTETVFSLMQTFVELMVRITSYFRGTVVDCAGDRVLSVFHRPATDNSPDPVREAITAAFWMQTIVQRVISPAFAKRGVSDVSVGIGIDYGPATIGCIGIRNNKRFVFFGDAANHAAKLQDGAGVGETVISAIAFASRPSFMTQANGWVFRRDFHSLADDRYRTFCLFADEIQQPPSRDFYMK